ncbi:glycerate kinase [Demequina sp.]|uniref:glycerate kinase n=1 Tax=Demequina sp. TaxID=2050685 RepID=UPI003A897CD6
MRILVLAQSWPVGPNVTMAAPEVAQRVAEAWTQTRPSAQVIAVPMGDGGPRSADALAGARTQVAGIEAVEVGRGLVLSPPDGNLRWDPEALGEALLALAAEHGDTSAPLPVTIPVGDLAPAGDAVELWRDDLAQFRDSLKPLALVAAVSSQRPLLGMRGMSAALRDRRESDTAIAVAAQAQEERWSAIARECDPVATTRSLLGSTRLSDAPGTGAASGLAYCLAAAGARLLPAGQVLADLGRAQVADAQGLDLALAVVPSLEPRTLDEGAVPAAAAAAGAAGVPCVILAPRSRIGRRDLMNAGVAAAHEGAAGAAGLGDGIARVAQTWQALS